MSKIDFSYASKVEHNFAQRIIIKTIETFSGKKKLEKLYKNYSLDDPNNFWADILNLMDIKVINKSKKKISNTKKWITFTYCKSSFWNYRWANYVLLSIKS